MRSESLLRSLMKSNKLEIEPLGWKTVLHKR